MSCDLWKKKKEKAKQTNRLMRKAAVNKERGVWSNEKVNENQKLACIVMCVIYLKINSHLTH